MANMHVRTINGQSAEIVCHFAIPNTNNDAGLNFRTAYGRTFAVQQATVLPDGDGTLGTISGAEKTAVNAAVPTVAELLRTFVFPGDWAVLNGTQRNARLDEWYASQLAEWTALNAARLQFHGYTR